MTVADVPVAEQISDDAFYEMGRAHRSPVLPEAQRRTEQARRRWRERTEHLLTTDPEGCWVAERAGEVLGFATSAKRDSTWVLCVFAVRPGSQAAGVGRPLLEAALSHARTCLRGLFASSPDPRAVRRYLLAGFELHPWITLHGRVDRSALPAGSRVREGKLGDRDLMDSVDRRVRDAAHGPDHEILLRHHPLLVVDRPGHGGQGYAYVGDDGGPVLLGATDRRTATALLWESLAMSPPEAEVEVAHVGPQNPWALDVAVQARLSIHTAGYLAVRGMSPPAPYIPHGALL